MAMVDTALEIRLARENWSEHLHRVNAGGFTVIEHLLDTDVCQRLIDSYSEPATQKSNGIWKRRIRPENTLRPKCSKSFRSAPL
jgi:hypothetical protein